MKLARDNAYLSKLVPRWLSKTLEDLSALSQGLEALRIIYSFVPSSANPTWSTLYIKAMSGELADSTMLRELSLSIKKLASDKMTHLLDALSPISGLDLEAATSTLAALVDSQASSKPLRSEHDQQHSTLRTTVVAQKVSLSKHQAALSSQDTQYSRLVGDIDEQIRDFLTQRIIAPKDLILNEVFVFDSKATCRDALGPYPRKAIERALGTPHDYLDCECCEGEEGLKASHPATALVYQLYLESGSLINVADMWAAFQAIVSPEQLGEEAEQDQEKLALFHRALAELRYLGMIKGSRKRTDHVMKLRWKGL